MTLSWLFICCPLGTQTFQTAEIWLAWHHKKVFLYHRHFVKYIVERLKCKFRVCYMIRGLHLLSHYNECTVTWNGWCDWAVLVVSGHEHCPSNAVTRENVSELRSDCHIRRSIVECRMLVWAIRTRGCIMTGTLLESRWEVSFLHAIDSWDVQQGWNPNTSHVGASLQ